MLMELQNIHIQVSIDSDEVACKEEDFGVLAKVTTYCLAWKNEVLEEEDLEAQLVHVIRTYREHNQFRSFSSSRSWCLVYNTTTRCCRNTVGTIVKHTT